ncbi:ATP-grasp domain-containing protein [Luteipulveratus halotolerans]|uniref:ATP-grasp domain-containing protein n=1 Tax=Luteipulveratus halotolerans TaxID=1631356 RepID=UPI0018D1E860|nr:ATP-grasp domain-containing protein [Luteipulveratus halotolerans]
MADEVRSVLGINPRNSYVAGQARIDKFLAQERLRQQGLPHIKSWMIQNVSEVDLLDLDMPCIVKPTNSAGSDGVSLVSSKAELRAHVSRILSQTNAMGSVTDRVVVQHVVAGTEYVIDGAMSPDGPAIASIGRYVKEFVFGAPAYRSLTWLSSGDVPRYDQLIKYVGKCLDALGVKVGCFHFEVFDTGQDWLMVEVGLRPHGGGHPNFTERLTDGVSQVSLEISVASGDRVDPKKLPPRTLPGRVIFLAVDEDVRFEEDPADRLQGLSFVEDFKIAVSKGDISAPPRSLFDTFDIGFVFIVANDLALLDEYEEKVRQEFRSTQVAL